MKARLSDKSIVQFAPDIALEILIRILKNACSVSGMELPVDTEIAESLKRLLLNFFLDFGYKLLNEDEFNLAFKLNSHPVDFGEDVPPQVANFGSFISVSYCGKVLSNYMILRIAFDRKLQNVIDGYTRN